MAIRPQPVAAALHAAVLSIAVLGTMSSFADAIDTNRPGFSFTPGVVERGRVQFETGVAYTREDADSNALSLPQAEIRFGIARSTEAYLFSSLGWLRVLRRGDVDTSGIVDPAAGIKYRVTDAGSPTQLALLGQLSIPVGDSALTGDDWDPSIGFRLVTRGQQFRWPERPS